LAKANAKHARRVGKSNANHAIQTFFGGPRKSGEYTEKLQKIAKN
jgi:hypothetical protein